MLHSNSYTKLSFLFGQENSFLSSVIKLPVFGFSSNWSVLNQENGANGNWKGGLNGGPKKI